MTPQIRYHLWMAPYPNRFLILFCQYRSQLLPLQLTVAAITIEKTGFIA